MTLTYVEVFTLRRHALDTTLAEHPVAAHSVLTAKRRITLQRSVLRYLAAFTADSLLLPASYVPTPSYLAPPYSDVVL